MKSLSTSRNHNPRTPSARLHGFTIVELLIVIVVIAILAAISIVAYVGIQNRAYNVSTVNSASQWIKVLATSYTIYGPRDISKRYSTDNQVCLGTREQYPAYSSQLQEGQCYVYSHTSDELEEAIEDIGTVSMQTRVFKDGTYDSRGISYWVYYLPDPDVAYMDYTLIGEDQDCVLPNTASSTSGGLTNCRTNVSSAIGGVPFHLD